ncbi:MAG: two pore domain potassium channel family protein [Burkholderiales bacterium]|nr:two pore domain potassium channel family protein [Burkholderiales bacterium]
MLSKPLFARTGLARLLAMAAAVLGLCGIGYYWIDPEVTTLSDGLWLAFTTAATVGYGDLVPSSTASRIFSMFVVLLGYGVLSLVTASIAAMFVDTQERQVERDILRGLHTEIASLRQEIVELRTALDAAPPAAPPATAGLAPQPAADTAQGARPAPARGLPRQPADETRA